MTGRKSPILSVVMAVYNSDRFVREAVHSILSQSFSDFEFIIVDDGSTDRTSEILHSFRDERIVCLRNDVNVGQTKSLNIGIRKSQGRYIARMDADDVALSDRFSLQIEFLENHPEIAVVGGSYVDVDERGRRLRWHRVPTDSLEIKAFLCGSGDLSAWCVAHPTVMIRRDALFEAGLYDESLGEGRGYPQDYELWSRMTAKYRFANISKPVLKYRILPTSDSRHFSERQIKERFLVTRRKIKRCLPDISPEDLSILSSMLEYQPQDSRASGNKVFALFERYFESYMAGESAPARIRKMTAKLKLYYVPRLFRTNKGLAFGVYLREILRFPTLFFDPRFLSKIMKVLHPKMEYRSGECLAC